MRILINSGKFSFNRIDIEVFIYFMRRLFKSEKLNQH